MEEEGDGGRQGDGVMHIVDRDEALAAMVAPPPPRTRVNDGSRGGGGSTR